MSNYLETIYFTEEYGPDKYPQKLCNHIYDKYYKNNLPSEEGKGKPKLLDIGSGKGNHLVGFSRLGMEAFGIDKRDECLKALDSFDIRDCDIEKDKFPFPDNHFDCVFTKSVLEHVFNTDNFLKETNRVLKPGGVAVIMTPDWKSHVSHFWDDYTHVRAFTRKSLQNALKMHNFEKVRCEHFLQLPFVWKHPSLKIIPKIISFLPEFLMWKDYEQSKPRPLIRFSMEKMLLGFGIKK